MFNYLMDHFSECLILLFFNTCVLNIPIIIPFGMASRQVAYRDCSYNELQKWEYKTAKEIEAKWTFL